MGRRKIVAQRHRNQGLQRYKAFKVQGRSEEGLDNVQF